MDKDLIIDVGQSEISIALLENKRLIELNQEKTEGRGYSVGDVYLGKVKKILPSLNAAFVDIGDEKDAFVHYLDLGLNFRAFDHFVRNINPNSDFTQLYRSTPIDDILEKEGKIERFLSPGQPIAVQIVKERKSLPGRRRSGWNGLFTAFSRPITASSSGPLPKASVPLCLMPNSRVSSKSGKTPGR